MVTLDDLLGPRVRGLVTFENGKEIELRARPRKGVGFTSKTVVSMRPAGERTGPAYRVELLEWFAGLEDVAPAPSSLARAVSALEEQGCEPRPRGKSDRTYDANCPVHGGELTLLVTMVEQGMTLKCRSGCSPEEILTALALSDSELLAGEDPVPELVMGHRVQITVRDARTILDWLKNQETGDGQ